MKQIATLLTLALAVVFLPQAQAQNSSTDKTLNIGYTNVAYLLSQMPESKGVEQELQEYSQQLQKQAQQLQQTIQEKYQAYERGQATMSDAIKADKEREIMDLQKRFEEFRQNADVDLRKKEAKLLEPLTQKISDAINTIAERDGYDYILNSDAGINTSQILLYAPEKKNVTAEVLKHMGVEVPEDAEDQ